MYLTHERYLELGGEKVTDQDTYEKLEYKAWMKVNTRTQGRIKEPLENIQRLMVELIDLEYDRIMHNVKQVANDGVSVTYSDNASYDDQEDELIRDYAGKLAWRGVSDLRQTS